MVDRGMNFSKYQKSASKTDKNPDLAEKKALLIPLLGIAGEAGALLSEYKKHLRDGEKYSSFGNRVKEELGDILWYVSDIATKFNFDLEKIAKENLRKTRERWAPFYGKQKFYDEKLKKKERIPRKFDVEIKLFRKKVVLKIDGKKVGDPLTDNAYEDDGYRFHDAFHLAYASILAWSPVVRNILKCKRRSKPKFDEIEDGGRARVIEEGIAALVYSVAKEHQYFDGVSTINSDLLGAIKAMTSHLEIKNRTASEWEFAILEGYRIWRLLRKHNGGIVQVDLEKRHIEFKEFIK